MIFRLSINLAGECLWPNKLLAELEGEFIIASSCNPGETVKFGAVSVVSAYGALSLWHHQRFASQHETIEYEEWFIEFIEANYGRFIASGAETVEILTEVFYDGQQCNFAIFDKSLLKRLFRYEISLPVSIYVLSDSDLADLVK